MNKTKVPVLILTKYILSLILPFAFASNKYLFLVILLGIYFIILDDNSISFENRLFSLYLISFMFSGIKLFGIHIYDIMLIFAFFTMVCLRKGQIIIPEIANISVFFAVVLLRYFMNINDYSTSDLFRYITAIVTFITFSNLNISITECKENIYYSIIMNMFFSISVYLLYVSNQISNYDGGLSSDIYLFTQEIRLNGFFTDPNKYMTYGMTLIAILMIATEYNKFIIFVGMMGTVISMSRSSIICIIVFITIYFIDKISKDMNRLSMYLFKTISLTISVIVVFLLFYTDIADLFFNQIGALMGRTRALELSSSIAGDNRVIIWKRAINKIAQRPLFGYGIGIISDKQFLPYPSHNTILCLLSKGGIILLLSFIILFWKYSNYLKAEIISFVLLPLLFLDMDTYRMFYLYYALLLSPLVIKNITVQEFFES